MKIKNILICGMAVLSFTACEDYLDVDPSSTALTPEVLYGGESEVDKALNGVYAMLLGDNTFGNNLYTTFQLNSDVDFTSNSNEAAVGNSPARFDVRSDASNVNSLWTNLYKGVEAANEFIYGLANSDIYAGAESISTTVSKDDDGNVITTETPSPSSLSQKMGEAKVIRAMFYHELISYFGDIPFSFQGTEESGEFLKPVTDRKAVSDSLINDLIYAAEYMYSDKDLSGAPERISREAAYAMIARLALQAGGYSLRHAEGNTTGYYMERPSDYKKYYQIARDYAKKVMDTGNHSLTQNYRDVFINECNFTVVRGDDAIFEIPFAKESTGCWGYSQGPTNTVDTESETIYSNYAWGATKGNARTTAIYRYSFDEKDLRRDFITGFWYYSSQGLPTPRFDYAMHNNKWSKLWNTTGLGKSTTSATGINFAYLRYTDVLLMFAEADNEINEGPTEEAKQALKNVRYRAFAAEDHAEKVNTYVEEAAASKEDFFEAVLNERKWEFAGENLRWKDLVRTNKYSEKLLYTFLAYYSIAENQDGIASYMDQVEEYDGVAYSQVFPDKVFYAYVKNYNDPNFPNTNLYMLYLLNPYSMATKPAQTPAKYIANNSELSAKYTAVTAKAISGSGSEKDEWNEASITWSNDGTIRAQILYSLYGYVRGDDSGNLSVVTNNGTLTQLYSYIENPQNLPAVRYLLPYPEDIISRSGGVYQNYYGY